MKTGIACSIRAAWPGVARSLLLRVFPLVSLLIVGCSTPLKQYWGDKVQSSFSSTNPFITNRIVFAVIEFDDQGDMWDRRQLANALDVIRKLTENRQPVTLVTFVHGWKHDASPNSSNLKDFYAFVSEMSTNQVADPDRTYVGVYLAWRGNKYQYKNPIMKGLHWLPLQLSFYNRKDTAAQVAGISCTEAILSLAAQTRGTDPANDQSKVVIVGHSFGGLIVERAITQAMLGGILMNPKRSQQKPPADLVLLVNPASEALIANKMIGALRRNPLIQLHAHAVTNNLRPWIISVTSKGDWATRYAFPAGRTFPSFFEAFRRPATNAVKTQRSLYLNTAPHSDRLITHLIVPAPRSLATNLVATPPPEDPDSMAAQKSKAFSDNRRAPRRAPDAPPSNPLLVREITTPDGPFLFNKRATNINESAYWVVRADKKLLPDHNTIFTPQFYALAAACLDLSEAQPSPDKKAAAAPAPNSPLASSQQ